MNESEINRIFQQRYNQVMRWVQRFKVIYFSACLILVLIAISMIWIYYPLFFFIIVIPAICYPLMHVNLFRRWSEKRLRRILTDATETTHGEVLQTQGASGIHQINYSYSVNEKKYKAYDIVNPQQFVGDFYEGLKITIRYDPNKPKISYIEI